MQPARFDRARKLSTESTLTLVPDCRIWIVVVGPFGRQKSSGVAPPLDGRGAGGATEGEPAGPRRLAAPGQRWRVLGETARAAEAYARADALGPLEAQGLSDWAENLVRQIAPGAAPSPDAIAVLSRLEKAQPNNALSLFYLGAASFAAGDKPAAVRRWKTLQALLPADAPIRGMLEERIKEAEGK